jgi:hypothetical protein
LDEGHLIRKHVSGKDGMDMLELAAGARKRRKVDSVVRLHTARPPNERRFFELSEKWGNCGSESCIDR